MAVIILAGGMGTRMKSRYPKALLQVAERPMISYLLSAIEPLSPHKLIVITGHNAFPLEVYLEDQHIPYLSIVRHPPPNEIGFGTGLAVGYAEESVGTDPRTVLVLSADNPLPRSETLSQLVEYHRAGYPDLRMVFFTTNSVNPPAGRGRVLRNNEGQVAAIVNEADATEEQKTIMELNCGIYCFDRSLFKTLKFISNENSTGEYYLTDLVEIYRNANERVDTIVRENDLEFLGANSRDQLALVSEQLWSRVREHWLQNGVTLLAPEQTFIDDTVKIGADTVISPGVHLLGSTTIGENVKIGTNSVIVDTAVKSDSEVPPLTYLYRGEFK